MTACRIASAEKVSTFSFRTAALTPAGKEHTMGKRTIEKHIKYNAEEWKIVSKKAAVLNQRAGTFIREMSVQGVIKNYDMKQFNHLVMSFNRIGNELNQIAKIANSTQSIYAKDIEDMKKSYEYLHTVFKNYLLPLKCEILT